MNNPLAFPSPRPDMVENEPNIFRIDQPGMTLRDYFAAHALNGHLANQSDAPAKIAQWSYEYADAMLKYREVTNE